MIKRFFLTAMLLAGLLPAHAIEVTETHDLMQDAVLATSKNIPILLMVSESTCVYCEQLKREVMRPMLIGGHYEDKILIRELMTDSGMPVKDFAGQTSRAVDLAHRYKAFVSPTVLFLDSNGNELAKRMVGVPNIDFYGWYLDEAIDESLLVVRGED